MVRRNRKRTSRLLVNGSWVYDQAVLKDHIRDFYGSLFQHRNVNPLPCNYEIFRPRLRDDELASLSVDVTV